MSQQPDTTTAKLLLEPLEAREVPAVGLDPAFGTGGLVLNPVGQVRFATAAPAAASGDKLVTAGTLVGTGLYGAGGDVAVVKLTATGAADPLFGGGDGLATFSFAKPHSVAAVAALANGKILVAGSVGELAGSVGPADLTPPSDMYVLRLNADGSRDTSFGVNGEADVDFGASDTLRRMVLLADGKMVLAGATATNNGTLMYPQLVTRLAVARLNANGTPDAGFGTQGEVVGSSDDSNWWTGGLAVQSDGKVLVSGSANPSWTSTDYSRRSEMTVLRFNANGTTDLAFGTAGRARTNYDQFTFSYTNDLALLSDGRIVVGGDSSYGQGLLAWFNPTGTLHSQEQFGVMSAGSLSSIQQVIALPQGGVEAVGYAGGSVGGTAVEYHAAPGAAADLRVLNPGPGYAISGGVSASGGKLVVTGVAGGVPIFDHAPPGGPLAVVRLADPGATQSATTFVRWTSMTDPPTGQVTLSAVVVPLLGTDAAAEGTITFRDGATVLGTVDLAKVQPSPWGGPTTASFDAALAPGDHTITAAYSGTARWAASSTPMTFHVGKSAAVTATLDVSSTNPAFGEVVTLRAQLATSSYGSAPVGGTVTFYDGATALGTSELWAGGMAVTVTNALTGGTHAIRAVYSGSTGFDPAESAPVTVVVAQQAADVTLTASTATAVVGQTVTFTATVGNPFTPGVSLGGTVTFYDGSTILGSAPVGANGVASYSAALRLGNHTVRAVYSGTKTTSPLVPSVAVTVGRAPTATALAASAAVGQSVTLTATVSPVSGTAFPVGTVEFREGSRVLGSAALDGRGQAKLTLTNLSAGAHAITAVYAGCSTCLGSTSTAAITTVGGSVATITTLATSAPTPVFGQTQTLTARVSGIGAAPTGRVEFYDGTALLGSAALDARGEAMLAATLNLGAHKLRAVYLGVLAFGASSSTWLTETVAKAPTTVSVSAAGSTVRAQVRANFAGSPVGTVTFKDGDRVLGTAAVNGNGVATFALGALAPGKHRITAVYSGSSCFLDATAAPSELVV